MFILHRNDGINSFVWESSENHIARCCINMGTEGAFIAGQKDKTNCRGNNQNTKTREQRFYFQRTSPTRRE